MLSRQGGAEGGLSLRHCLHLNVNSYKKLCIFQKLKFSKQFIFVLYVIKNGLLNIFVVFTEKN